jgi:hypothetical protein
MTAPNYTTAANTIKDLTIIINQRLHVADKTSVPLVAYGLRSMVAVFVNMVTLNFLVQFLGIGFEIKLGQVFWIAG